MENLKISTAQFENRSGDKEFNLSRIESLARDASVKGSHAIAFHECSVTGYSFARNLSKEEMTDLGNLFLKARVLRGLQKLLQNTIFISLPVFLKKTVRIIYSKPIYV